VAIPWFSPRRDGVVLVVLALLVIMLVASLVPSSRTFAFSLTALIGTLAAVGFVRRGRPRTWIPPLLASGIMAVAFVGMFTHEGDLVASVDDTLLGFQPATAFLVYVLWIPAYFTLSAAFAWLFDDTAEVPGHADVDEASR